MRRMSKFERSQAISGVLFALPYIIGLVLFTAYPLVASMYYSLCRFDVLTPPSWIGLGNYIDMFTGADEYFWQSMYNTVYYAALSVPLTILTGVGIAMLLNMKVKGMAVYRTIFFLPVLVPIVASSILWLWILNPQYGLINNLLYKLFSIEGPGWIADERWSKFSLVLMSVWAAGQSVVIYLAGLQDIPEQLYEAAELDGASTLGRIRHITIPMLTPVIFFNLVMGVINSLQVFTQAYIMTDGGPANSTLFYMLHLYRNAFGYLNMGYACALAWFLFVVIIAITLIVFKTSGRWVFYSGG
ncbi:MAG: sugar ABC transporter permease [Firmicutes bacterium]|nr:sugar ABC transporter permease [Bacillota bacterium]